MIKKFTLGAVDWYVEMNTERLEDLNVMGLCEYVKTLITLNGKVEGSMLNETLYHELIHAILHTMGENELATNEKFVQQFAVLLYQFEKTKTA